MSAAERLRLVGHGAGWQILLDGSVVGDHDRLEDAVRAFESFERALESPGAPRPDWRSLAQRRRRVNLATAEWLCGPCLRPAVAS